MLRVCVAPARCRQVRATKRISVEEAPNVLTVHLKRFEFGGFGSKINKMVEYGNSLDLRPYMSKTSGPKQVGRRQGTPQA